MPKTEDRPKLQDNVFELLKGLDRVKGLKDLFFKLKYDCVNSPISRRPWPEAVVKKLAEDPVVLATGGHHSDFEIIYSRLDSVDLRQGYERPVVSQFLRHHPNAHNALFVFSNVDQDRWHFLHIKQDNNDTTRKIFRRITVGPEERLENRLRTASERITKLDLSDEAEWVKVLRRPLGALDIQTRHDEAFDVETLNQQFFTTFAVLYDKVVNDIGELRGFEKKAKPLAHVLLNRMLFLYFIQKKGWLDNKQDYLYSRFHLHKNAPNSHSFYLDVLSPLFASLSNPDIKIQGVGAVPFLNGGLFEEKHAPSHEERPAYNGLKIKNSTFEAIFDDLLEKYNFTVMEDTPFSIEVAVNPDMLGRIFESLILELEKDPDKDLRKLTGSYYTPRPIVHFMCQEALKEYLVTKLVNNNGSETELVRSKIDALMAMPPAEELDNEQIETIAEHFTPSEAKLLQHAVLDCRACDPAVGSGAFPVGMLHEMVAVIARLELRVNGPEALKKRNYYYDLKKQIVQTCLYGVDIQEQAVRLCELRLWLSLVVDYQIDLNKPFALAVNEVLNLPNLSFRIVRGDSLLERLFGHVVQLDALANDAETKQLIKSLQQDKHDHFHAGRLAEKRRLEQKILTKQAELAEILIEQKRAAMKAYQTNLFGEEGMTAKERQAKIKFEAQLAELTDLMEKVAKARTELQRMARQKEPLGDTDLETLRSKYFQNGKAPTFMWRVEFAEVFLEKDGFDVIIGNPPYGIVFDEPRKEKLLNNYLSFVRNNDIFAAFMELCGRILKSNSIFILITPNTYIIGPYFESMKRQLLLMGRPIRIVDFGNQRVFPDPDVFTAILKYRKQTTLENIFLSERLIVDAVTELTDNGFKIASTVNVPRYAEPPFVWATTSTLEQQITRTAQELSQWCDVKDIGFNYWTKGRGKVRGESIGSRVLYSGRRLHKQDKPFLKGEDVLPFVINNCSHFLRHNYESYLNPTKDTFRFTPAFLERVPKIVYRQTADRIIAAIDREARYTDKTVHLIVFKNEIQIPFSYEYLVGILNSKLMLYVYRQRAREEGRLFAQVKVFQVKSLPIVVGSYEQQRRLEKVIKQLENIHLDETSRLVAEKKLNDVVYEIYGLHDDEIVIIEGSIKSGTQHHRQPMQKAEKITRRAKAA